MEKKSANNILIAVAVLLLVAAASFGVWKFFLSSPAEQDNQTVDTTDEAQETDDTEDADANEGMISGSLTYPSEGPLPEMEIHAYNIETETDYVTKNVLMGDEYTYGYGYEISVPAGTYHVYAVLAGGTDRAYYNEFVKCGMDVACTDTTPIEVTVTAGSTTKDIMPGDWYN